MDDNPGVLYIMGLSSSFSCHCGVEIKKTLENHCAPDNPDRSAGVYI